MSDAEFKAALDASFAALSQQLEAHSPPTREAAFALLRIGKQLHAITGEHADTEEAKIAEQALAASGFGVLRGHVYHKRSTMIFGGIFVHR
jgi:hypothetical protein